MSDRDFQAWADAIDSRPSYGSRSAGRIDFMGFPGELVESRSRQVPPWKRSAARRQYQLLLMRARMERL